MPNNEHTCSLRHLHQFKTPSVITVCHGTESVSILGPKIWETLPYSFKKIANIDTFKKKIKTWQPSNCLCRLCKVDVQNIGFL